MDYFIRYVLTAACCIIIILLPSIANSAELPVFNIGVVQDGPSELIDETKQIFIEEITSLISGEFDIRFPEDKTFVGNGTIEGIKSGFDRLLADKEVDFILTLGIVAADYAGHYNGLSKPVIAPFTLGTRLQGLPYANGISGVNNLNYLDVPFLMQRNIEIFREIVRFNRLGFFISKNIIESVPIISSHLLDLGDELGIEIIIIPIGGSVEEMIAAIPDNIEAAFVNPLITIDRDEFDRFSQALIEKKLPSFAALGEKDVQRGLMMGMIKDDFIIRRARRTALNIQRILLGENASQLKVAYSENQRMSFNRSTARAIGVSPPWEILSEAEIISDIRKDIARNLTLEKVMIEAMKVNLDVAVKDLYVSAGAEEVKNARANLFPKVEVSALGLQVDADRAEASMGQQSEKTFSGSAKVSQVIYSEPAWANYSIQKNIQKSREAELQSLRLDVALEASTAYLHILQAKTNERIQKDNLKLTRSNLETAQVREFVGIAGPAELYRWEAEISAARNSVISANSQRNLAEMELNRILHRPLEEPFTTAEAELDDESELIGDVRLFKYIDNRRHFSILRDFYVQQGINASPEIAQIDAAIEAQNRWLKSTWRSYFAPTMALSAELSRLWWEDGAGTESPDIGALMGENPSPKADNNNWNVGLSLSLPIFEGGAKQAVFAKAQKELFALKKQRIAAEDAIEQRIRSAMHIAQASFAAIKHSRAQSEAAHKSLNVMKDAYAQGAVSILDLLDIQNTAKLSDEGAANAVYRFVADYLNIQRAVGNFDVFSSKEETDRFFDKLEKYLIENGAKLSDK